MDIKITMAAARVNAHLSQRQMAEKLGVSKDTIGKWERGEVIPRYNQLEAFCGACGLPLESIFLPTT